MGKKLKVLYDKKSILKRVTDIAQQISRDYPSGELILVGVLKGGFIFLADLVRALKIPVHVDFVRLASYGTSTHSSGKVKILKDLEISITDKDVIIVEDIIDTGLSLKFLKQELIKRRPRSLKICALLDKKSRRQVEIKADYVGITMEKDYFVVGYGLDFSEQYRQLPEIFFLDP
ncbi:MAG TPA: hypoxanthine phosphoribosyltransferase [Thermodesulfobacteriota bacterium]|nr:hypoxanthine phosphoribosyltransferase [Thermodesulfobacteriota bacterium]